MSAPRRTQMLEIAHLVRPHGLRGSVFLKPSGGSALHELVPPTEITLRKDDNEICLQLLELSKTPKGWIGKFDAWSRLEDVEPWRGAGVAITRESLPPAYEDEYYVEDLVGCRVREVGSEEILGELVGVEPLGAPGGGFPDRWWVRSESGEWSLPAVQRYIERVDLEGREVWIQNCRDLMSPALGAH